MWLASGGYYSIFVTLWDVLQDVGVYKKYYKY